MLELALHVLDILQNAVEAGAENVELTVREDIPADWLAVTVVDDGRGMDAETAARVTDPFYTTRSTRHVGLGLPLYKMAAETAGGNLSLRSAPGSGTTVEALFRLSHPDRQPLGDIAATLLAFLLSRRPIRLVYRHEVLAADHRSFDFDTAAIQAELDGLSLGHPLVAQWLAEFLREGEADLVQ